MYFGIRGNNNNNNLSQQLHLHFEIIRRRLVLKYLYICGVHLSSMMKTTKYYTFRITNYKVVSDTPSYQKYWDTGLYTQMNFNGTPVILLTVKY